jgi:hypothetical protein
VLGVAKVPWVLGEPSEYVASPVNMK